MFAQNLRSASMAGVPAVAVTTTEWERIVEDIRYVAANVNQNMMLWNHIDGLMDERGESVVGPADVIGTLEYIQQTEDTFVVFLNFNVSLKSPAVIQKVREAANVIKTTGSTMVFVSASGSIPPELEKEIILLDYDLPDKAGIAEVVSSLVEVNPADESVEALINAAVGLTKNEAENVIALALAKNDRLITEKNHRGR